MTGSSWYSLLLLGVPFLVAMALYGVLRGREMRAVTAAVVAIGAGVLVSFALSAAMLIWALA